MKTTLVLLLFFSSAQLPSKKIVHQFSWWTHDNADGEPSKCDCDYRGEDMTLYDDSTCIFREQRGRLDPKYILYKGKWHVKEEIWLELQFTTQRHGLTDEDQICSITRHYKLKNGKITDDDHHWRGR